MYVFADNPYLCFDLNIDYKRLYLDGVNKFDDGTDSRYVWNSDMSDLFMKRKDSYNHVYEVNYRRFRMQEELAVI
jgi:hypothetical protein